MRTVTASGAKIIKGSQFDKRSDFGLSLLLIAFLCSAQSVCPPSGLFNACSVKNCSFETCCNSGAFHWFDDTCYCPYDCINCHGGVPKRNGNNGHACTCLSGTTGIDCRECGCPPGSTCVRSNSISLSSSRQTIFSCPSTAKLFQGVLVGEHDPLSGSISFIIYSSTNSTPIVANCTFLGCLLEDNPDTQIATCQSSQCCTAGFGIRGMQQLWNGIAEETIVTIARTGSKFDVHNACVPIPLSFSNCTTSFCTAKCSNLTSCSACTSFGECEWCLSSNTCEDPNSMCRNYLRDPQLCPVPKCNTFSSCETCTTSASQCDWCLDDGRNGSCEDKIDTCNNKISDPQYCNITSIQGK